MWYILFVVYAPYAMLPLPLRWCVLAGYGTALTHMVMAGISLLQDSTDVRKHIVDDFWNFKAPSTKEIYLTHQLINRSIFRRTLLEIT